MIQNPNVKVKNSLDKAISIFSGAVTAQQRMSLNSDKHYFVFSVNCTSADDTKFIRLYVTPKNGGGDSGRYLYSKGKRGSYIQLGSVFYSIFYVDISELRDFDVLIYSTNGYSSNTSVTINGYYTDSIPDFDEHIISNASRTPNDTYNNIFNNGKRWLKIVTNVSAVPASGESQLYVLRSGDAIDSVNRPHFVDNNGFKVQTISLNQLGEFTYYCEVFDYELFTLFERKYVNASTYTLDVYLTNDVFVVPNGMIDKKDFTTFSLVKKGNYDDCYDGFWLSHNWSSSKLTVGDNTHQVTITLSAILGANAKMYDSGNYARFISKRISGQQNYKIFVFIQLANMDAFTCEITDGIEAISTTSNWVKSKFWEKYGTNRKIPVTNESAVDAHHRLDTTLPSSRYDYNTNGLAPNGMIQYQGIPDLHTLGTICRTAQMTAIGAYNTYDERVSLWATSDGGQNWVSMFDFTPYKLPSETYSAYINTNAFSTYSGGLTLRKVVPNTPSAEEKEPATMWSISDLTLSGITKGAKTIVSCTAHGLNSGDIVLFQGGSGDWAQLASTGSTDTTIGDNVYFIEKIDANSFYLREYNGSYDTQLACRHIHSVNESPSGLIFACGEEYPYGWIMYVEQYLKDAGDVVDLTGEDYTNNNRIYRLTSASTSIQRCCGVLQMSNGINPKMLYFVDTSLALRNNNYTIEGRTTTPRLSSNGIWGGEINNIDDWLENECVEPLVEPAIWTEKCGNTIVCRMQLGGIIVSVDNGKSWEYVSNQNRKLNPYNGEKDGHIVLGTGYEIVPN